jgi:hypothetical protein
VGLDYTVFASGLSPVLDPILDPLTALLLLGGGFAGL